MKRAELLKTAKPILFNTDMVRAILDGRKTETRRVVKPRSRKAEAFFIVTQKSDGAFVGVYDAYADGSVFDNPQPLPYHPGDILYVRETWAESHIASPDKYLYKADYDISVAPYLNWKWHPSIHMPKEAARIFLRVTNVRVERLQDITVRDMKAEGFLGSCFMCFHGRNKDVPCAKHVDKLTECSLEMNVINGQHMSNFINVWDSTIPKKNLDIYGWDANPWVWVIEFERIEVEA